ncbi:hypothetical protein JOJ87_001852 [Rhodococcus ruber]|uniref:DUF262 domain-containing protein n=1 Tax=Rhodococcus ruber TaxID=1830 RepID=UPI001DBD010B|nr:DUF262 domain-containing HNH endonuclease family protein [Rhodococcus ruber]MBP2211508.1 hypothetical protein [Rhodococcus ruber]
MQQLFESDVRYLVPLYQRPYVWNEDNQLEPLWEDVTALLEHQESGEIQFHSHFLGAIVLDQEPTAPGRIPQYTVIDGQQRLTTLQLLIAAISDAMRTAGAEDDAGLLRDLVTNDPRRAKGTDRLKVWPTNANREAFTAVMLGGVDTATRLDDPGNLIDEAFEYFMKRATDYLTAVDEPLATDETIAQRAERLRITVCDLLKVVSITLEPSDNAQVIFETLNARGTPLLALDLVKNALFREASRQQRDTDQLYAGVWQKTLEDEYWRKERRQGRLKRPVGEHFLMHWLTMKLERVVPATELFATFRHGILQQSADAESLLREFCRDATVMRSFDDFIPGTVEGDFFARLEPLGAGPALPVVLLLLRSGEVGMDQRRQALRILESFLARRAIMRLTTQNYNRLVPRMVAAMKSDLGNADRALWRVLIESDAYATRWPTDAEFLGFLRSRDVYDYVSRNRLVMAFAAVEASLNSKKTDVAAHVDDLSLEHIMPREWEKHWPIIGYSESSDEDRAAERAARLHRIGNLTIVSGSLNSAMKNAPWETKRAALNRHSRLLLNARLAERDRWDEIAIDEHGEWLANRLMHVWPGPDAPDWNE